MSRFRMETDGDAGMTVSYEHRIHLTSAPDIRGRLVAEVGRLGSSVAAIVVERESSMRKQ
ncbi:hypothetical protein GQ600_20472 [Phytophthora cactorum]|nr:hypothetical protein GQ600_20472 [Phytophthora cactorum]